MITGEIFISTTWAASTSYIPFDKGMVNVHNVEFGGTKNRGQFATTAYVQGVWEIRKFEEDMKNYLGNGTLRRSGIVRNSVASGLGGHPVVGNAFSSGTIIEVHVRKLKALKSSPNRSGVQVDRRMVKGNKLIIRYVAQGELVRP